MIDLTIEEQLLKLYAKRKSLYNKGANDEKLNEKIRDLQSKNNFKVKEV